MQSSIAYMRQFFATFLHECYSTWRQELLASTLVSAATYVLMLRSHDPAAWGTFKVAIVASGIVLGGFAIWHLLRTPFLLHNETVERLGQEAIAALESQKIAIRQEIAHRVSPTDWRDLSEKFNAIGSFQYSAQFQTTQGVTKWRLYDTQCKALCTLAGTMLMASTAISPQLSDQVRLESDPVSRWLEYLKATTSAASYRLDYATEELPSGEKIVHLLGRIDNVPRESVAACIKCSALELAG
ncbi:hypothetical protein GCM10011507_35190 [Edaphobacter acidisoli]|uniref:Uncharacterized protein n=1 Tax=Edaphobacter acidisoli TaxID=2040573 RepID=A0A916S271_9BACT|nr:hypothetical protein [Edaphobacter acidisoli]GGA80937.1 hypothetical protein GCM10011507_35190 [Edaphobacter acidisoli]